MTLLPTLTLDTSPSTLLRPPPAHYTPTSLSPLTPRGRPTSAPGLDFDASCARCIRARAFSAPPPPPRPPTNYPPTSLAAVNRALARAALAHAAAEPYGLGAPVYENVGQEVARFRHLSASVRVPAADTSALVSAHHSPTLPPVSPSTDRHGNVSVPLSFRARYTLVVGPRPGTFRYHVTDDWSNAEATIRATPKLRRIVARAVAGLFVRRVSGCSDTDGEQDIMTSGEIGVLKSSRTLPRLVEPDLE